MGEGQPTRMLFYVIGNCILLHKKAPLWIALWRRRGCRLHDPPEAEQLTSERLCYAEEEDAAGIIRHFKEKKADGAYDHKLCDCKRCG